MAHSTLDKYISTKTQNKNKMNKFHFHTFLDFGYCSSLRRSLKRKKKYSSAFRLVSHSQFAEREHNTTHNKILNFQSKEERPAMLVSLCCAHPTYSKRFVKEFLVSAPLHRCFVHIVFSSRL